MDVLGWMTVVGALLLPLLLVLLGRYLRERQSQGQLYVSEPDRAAGSEEMRESQAFVATAGDAEDTQASPMPPLAPEAVGIRELLLRMYNAAFPLPIQGVSPKAEELDEHLRILEACHGLLARKEFQTRHLPRRPHLLPKLMRAVNDPDASLEKIAQIIEQDPTLSTNLLRIANSPFYRIQGRPVESLVRATTLLGLEGLRPVVAAALVQPVMRTGEGVFGRLPVLIWDHTQLAAAFASSLVLERRGSADPFSVQMLGLLYGLGGIIAVQTLRDQYTLHPLLRPYPEPIAKALHDLAVQAAGRIAEEWELAEEIRGALPALCQEEARDNPLVRMLNAGLVAGALEMLCRQYKLERDVAGEMLLLWAQQQGIEDANLTRLWERFAPEQD